MKKKLLHLLVMVFCITSYQIKSQCNNTSSFGSATAPAQGASLTVTTCQYGGEYCTISSVVSGNTYSTGSSVSTDFFTIRSGSSSGPVVAFGQSPLVWTATSAGTYYMHCNTNSSCGTISACRSVFFGCLNPACNNTSAYGTASAPALNNTITITTCNYAGEYATISGVVAGNTYSSSSSVLTDYITIRSGSSSGPVVATGVSPVVWVAQVAGTHYIHVNSNSSCGTVSSCRSNILSCSASPLPPNCTGTPPSATAVISTTSGCPNSPFGLTATGTVAATGVTYQWQSCPTTTGTWVGVPTATNVILSTSVSATTYFRLLTTCTLSALSATSSIVSYSVVNPGPCVCNAYQACAVTLTSDEEILGVAVGSMNNVSTCTTTAPGPGSSNQLYSNYTNFVTPASVCPGAVVPFTITAGTCGGWYGTSLVMYIDYNSNGVFTDAGEMVYLNTAATQGLNSGTFTVPITAAIGTTRLRIVLTEGTGSTPPSVGSISNWGEVEDYCFTVLSPPTITASGGSVCPGAPFVITPSGASTYTYIASTGTLSTGSTGTVNPITNSTYTVTGTGSNGCVTPSNSAFAGTVAVALLQSPTLTSVSSPTAYCRGGSATLTVAGANTYTWTGLGSNASSVSVSPTVTTVYTVSGTGTNVCNGVVAVTVVVNQIPTITVNSGTLCTGYNFTLTPGGASTYTITGPSGTVSPVVNPLANINYTVNGTSTAGCASIPSVAPISTVLVIPSPTITASSGTVCIGLNFSLNPTGSNGTYSVNGVTISNAAGAYSPAVNTTYSVSGTNNNGCVSFSPAVANVTVVPIPTITAVASSPSICVGQASTNLSASGANTYTWSNNATGASVAVSPNQTTVFQVTGTSTLLCNSSTTVNVFVWQLPPVLLNTSQNFVCVGGPSTLIAQGANTYSWSNGSSSFSTVVNPTISSNYSVTGTDLNGCYNTATVAINVNTVVMNVAPTSTTVCLGSSFTFSASGATTYSWNGTFGFNTFLATPTGPTAYTVTAVDPNNCPQSKVVLANVYQLPVVTAAASRTLICLNESATITASGASTYSWSNGASTSSIVVSPNIDITYMYTVVGTDTNNCTATASQSLVVSKCVGLESRGVEANLWSVYPNPGYGVYTVELGGSSVKSIQVIDVTGRIILNEKSNSEKFIVNINNYPAGVYYLKVSTTDSNKTIKLIKE